jgi:hypothetical protein
MQMRAKRRVRREKGRGEIIVRTLGNGKAKGTWRWDGYEVGKEWRV